VVSLAVNSRFGNSAQTREALPTCTNDTLLRHWTISRHHLPGLDPPERAAEALVATCYNAHG